MKEEKIKILILNYNGKQYLEDCLDSIRRINYSNFSVIVIDNNSSDGSDEYVASNYPDIDFFQTGKNLMFSGGYNCFFERNSEESFYLILNNDTIVDSEILNSFMAGVRRYGRKNIYGSKIMFMNSKNKIWYAGAKVDLLKGVIKHLNIRKNDSGKLEDSKTDYVTGCSMFVHSAIIDKLDGFDSAFTMYMEDVDFCLRARDAGSDCYFLNAPKVFHHVSGSAKNKQLKIMLSYIKLSNKHTGLLSFINVPLFFFRRLLSI
ncbi:MAG: hypothetical protein CMG00_06695 [Candidatus Marinimicrobia bacterium]|nr:hypothetical protein [Candidatus Neomarinimicrobiota bacterium]